MLEEQSAPTHGLTAYVISNSILPFNVTIIDTPGVVNEKGNMDVSTLIKTWFEQVQKRFLQALSRLSRHYATKLDHYKEQFAVFAIIRQILYRIFANRISFSISLSSLLKCSILPIVVN